MATRRLKRLRIYNQPESEWSLFPGRFVIVFGALWLFLEPLTVLKVIPDTLPDIRAWWYAVLVALVIVITVVLNIFAASRYFAYRKIRFIPLEIVLTESGERWPVEVSKDMRIGEFVDRFLKKVKETVRPESLLGSLLANEFRYNNTLIVRRTESQKQLDRAKTVEPLVSNQVISVKYMVRSSQSSTQ
jgi:hypothetical protein